ncbi:F420-dependent oxidoreductase, putative [Methanocorpusculum labreanum Z]|uniref:F420-dependent oxidoreductase, putative n=1 Tax=Methanocorpusculum labreanum (strain ATCC 43576 / DSM 4855 / Z) TaxID=410358 RepID=A2ST46_METLZ|nr:coenzyme F420-0:L-glutamate ligase [Methanocorpusculum labreanum]ABN07502.1 F420-dependent oxidoreductase, putative [Methanocorpusculum labreanum Z]
MYPHMSGFFSVYGISTGLLVSGDDIIDRVISSLKDTEAKSIENGDILLFAESPLSTTEGRNIRLDDITPSAEAYRLSEKYHLDARLAEVVIQESDTIVGGVPGYLLAGKWDLILPNAGVDESNAPDGWVTRLPADPEASAKRLRDEIRERTGKDTAVIIIDSRTHSMRLGVSGVAIGCSGIQPISDERGKPDLYGNKLQVTRRAIADSLASTAELLMGEASEGVPVVLVRGYPYIRCENCRIETIPAEEDLFLNLGK